MRQSDYPAPSYAAQVWLAHGRLWLARSGHGTIYFEDTPDGLNELRMQLLASTPARTPLGPAKVSGTNLAGLPATPVRRADVRGRPKLDEADLWGEADEDLSADIKVEPAEKD